MYCVHLHTLLIYALIVTGICACRILVMVGGKESWIME